MIDSAGVTSPRPKRLSTTLLARLSVAAVLISTLVIALASCSGGTPVGYASLGDSLAAGVGSSAPSEKSYSALYRESLERRTGREVEYRQLGLSGETADSFIGEYPEGHSQLTRAEKFLGRYPNARVTLSLGGNDLLRMRNASNQQRLRAISEYGKDLNFILDTLKRSSHPPPEIIVLAIYNPEPGGFTERWTGEMNEEIRTTARANGASVAPTAQAFRGHTGKYLRYYENGEQDIHPNDAGYAALAQSLLRAENPEWESLGSTDES